MKKFIYKLCFIILLLLSFIFCSISSLYNPIVLISSPILYSLFFLYYFHSFRKNYAHNHLYHISLKYSKILLPFLLIFVYYSFLYVLGTCNTPRSKIYLISACVLTLTWFIFCFTLFNIKIENKFNTTITPVSKIQKFISILTLLLFSILPGIIVFGGALANYSHCSSLSNQYPISGTF